MACWTAPALQTPSAWPTASAAQGSSLAGRRTVPRSHLTSPAGSTAVVVAAATAAAATAASAGRAQKKIKKLKIVLPGRQRQPLSELGSNDERFGGALEQDDEIYLEEDGSDPRRASPRRLESDTKSNSRRGGSDQEDGGRSRYRDMDRSDDRRRENADPESNSRSRESDQEGGRYRDMDRGYDRRRDNADPDSNSRSRESDQEGGGYRDMDRRYGRRSDGRGSADEADVSPSGTERSSSSRGNDFRRGGAPERNFSSDADIRRSSSSRQNWGRDEGRFPNEDRELSQQRSSSSSFSEPSSMHQRRDRHSERESSRRRDPRGKISRQETFAGITVEGSAAEWLRSQRQLSGGEFKASPIQELSIKPIYDGVSCSLHAPTGSGKTLCYLLPLLKRLEEELREFTRPGLRMLILVPTALLQMQTAALARALLGAGRGESVTMMTRKSDNAKASPIVVATPRQICELLDDPLLGDYWTKSLGNLDMVVIDEADKLLDKWTKYQRKKRFRDEKIDPAVRLLETVDEQADLQHRRDCWQLVGASATMNYKTKRRLKFSSGIEVQQFRVEGSGHTKAADTDSKLGGGQYGDGTTTLPPGLKHWLRICEPFQFPKVMAMASRNITELWGRGCHRVLVILCTTGQGGRMPKDVFGLNLVLGQLRFRCQEANPNVEVEARTVSAALEDALDHWTPEGSAQRLRGRGAPRKLELVVANAEGIRGVHLDNVGGVVVIGEPDGVPEYLHCAGRTSRYQPGYSEPVAGTVVSVMPPQMADKMTFWANLAGFKLVEAPDGTPLGQEEGGSSSGRSAVVEEKWLGQASTERSDVVEEEDFISAVFKSGQEEEEKTQVPSGPASEEEEKTQVPSGPASVWGA